MKIGGRRFDCPHEVIISIPRGDNVEDAATFIARAVVDYSDFNRLCPEPKKRVRVAPDGTQTTVDDDMALISAQEKRRSMDLDFMCIKSLQATPGLEWDTVQYDQPETWANWRIDLEKSGFSRVEINRVFAGICQANALDEDLVKACRESFLRGRTAAIQS